MSSQEKEIEQSINTVKERLAEMGYEYISNDNNSFTYKCSRCNSIETATKSVINKEYVNKRWKLCSNCGFCNISLDELTSECKKTNNTKSLISSIKQSKMYIDELTERTSFLNEYEPDINERVYYLWNNISEIIKCPYCGKKAKWSGRLSEGYKTTCCSKECEHKRISEQKSGSTKISDNRLNDFIEWQDSLITVTDADIIEHFKYEKYLEYVTNSILLNYLDSRFSDSYSREESLSRILYKPLIEKKPICANPNCNKPVKWIGRKRALYTTYCCDSCAATAEETLKKRKETNKEKWGTENIYDSDKYKEQYIEQYNVPYVFLRKDVIEKSNNKKLEKYGTIYPSQTQEVKDKVKETNQERYNVNYTLELDYVKEKTYSEETRQKIRDTNIERFGVMHPMQSDEVKERMKETNQEKYGVNWCIMTDDAKQKAHSDEAKQKQKNTNIERYGVPYAIINPDIQNKVKQTVQNKYGVPCVLMLDEVKQKSFETLCKNNKFQTSNQEEQIYNILCSIFKEAIHHYRDNDFQYNVDFYIPEYKLFIEYQGSHFHNKRSFFNTKEDQEEFKVIKEKADNKEVKTGELSQYSSILYTWTNLDVKKRNEALKKSLNYLEIYSFHNVDDIINQLNILINCLTHTKLIDYSKTTIKSEYEYYKNLSCMTDDALNTPVTNKNIIVKNYQFCEFYKKEMDIYAHNPILRRKLIQNRMKYLNKKEYELTVADILTGFKKSGIYYGYSHFNPMWTNWFVNKYDIKSVYDPCGGWGHHLLGMLQCEKIIYNDFNKTVCNNIKTMKDDLNIEQLEVHYGNGTTFVPSDDIDAWFMCPPYYNLETYNDKTFKDIDDYKKFLNKIFNIWKNSSSRIFGIIIREDYISLIDSEYSESFKLNVSDSHFAKMNDKKFREYFYIFKKLTI